jgi:hypothetical protein
MPVSLHQCATEPPHVYLWGVAYEWSDLPVQHAKNGAFKTGADSTQRHKTAPNGFYVKRQCCAADLPTVAPLAILQSIVTALATGGRIRSNPIGDRPAAMGAGSAALALQSVISDKLPIGRALARSATELSAHALTV